MKSSQVETAYSERHAEACALVERIRKLVENIPALGPDGPKIDWGHVGDLGYLNKLLREVVEFLGRR